MSIHETKRAPWGVYRVVATFTAPYDIEVAVCCDISGYFELPARTVRHHRNVSEEEFKRLASVEVDVAFSNKKA